MTSTISPETFVGRLREMYARMGTLKTVQEALDGSTASVDVGEGGSREVITLKKSLGWLELTMFGIGGIIGAGVFVLTGAGAKDYAGPAVFISYLLAGGASLFSALCYTEFAVDLPLAGSAYNYVMITFGEFAAWICGWNLVLEYSVSCSAVARGWTSYLATLVGTCPSTFRFGEGVFSLDPLAVVIIGVLTVVLIIGIKESARFNTLVTTVNLVTIGVVLFVGLPKIDSNNFNDFAPYGIKGIFTGSSIVFFSFIGFDTLATCAEEVKQPSRDLPIGIMGSLAVCTVLYVLMAVTISGMVPYQDIDVDAPFASAFNAVGNRAVSFIVSIGAVTGITTSLLVSLLGQTRIYMVIARDNLLPGWFGVVNKRFRTPVNATIITSALSSVLAFFVDIDVLATLVSIGTLFVFALVCAAVLMRRYSTISDSTSRQRTLVRILAVVVTSTVTSICYNAGAPAAVSIIFLIAFFASCGSFYYPHRMVTMDMPKKFAVPLLPWVPCFGLFTNIFLISSLGVNAYIRFVVWFLIGLAIYFFYGYRHSTIGRKSSGGGAMREQELSTVEETDEGELLLNSE